MNQLSIVATPQYSCHRYQNHGTLDGPKQNRKLPLTCAAGTSKAMGGVHGWPPSCSYGHMPRRRGPGQIRLPDGRAAMEDWRRPRRQGSAPVLPRGGLATDVGDGARRAADLRRRRRRCGRGQQPVEEMRMGVGEAVGARGRECGG
jgi:hypothetical protein